MDREDKFSDDEIVTLWNLLSEVPINYRDEIEESFLGFRPGTYRFFVVASLVNMYSGDLGQLIDEAEKRKFEMGVNENE